jgi:hypothetical protein
MAQLVHAVYTAPDVQAEANSSRSMTAAGAKELGYSVLALF